MATIAIIGAGSMQFTRQVVSDIARSGPCRDAEIRLHDIDAPRLALARELTERIARESGAGLQVFATTDLRQALKGVDYAICTILVGGHQAAEIDFQIAARYGILHTVADTLGIGGISRALRTLPHVLDIAAVLADAAPSAVLLNYTNPLSMVMMAVHRRFPELPAYGLCHSVYHTAETLSDYLGVPFKELEWVSAGINHMAWMLTLRRRGEDLYPQLAAKSRDPQIRARDAVRFELMDRVGYFVTESSKHNAEYFPYFVGHPAEIERLQIPVGRYRERTLANEQEYARIAALIRDPAARLQADPSAEYAPAFIAARESGALYAFQANVPNAGLITNLPDPAVVEVPCYLDRGGVHATAMGTLPEPLAALNRLAVNVQLLTVDAVLNQDRDRLYQAAMMDPVASTRLTLDAIVHLIDDLVAAHGPAVPQLRSRRLWGLRGSTSV
jgi:alpha-galactosidase